MSCFTLPIEPVVQQEIRNRILTTSDELKSYCMIADLHKYYSLINYELTGLRRILSNDELQRLTFALHSGFFACDDCWTTAMAAYKLVHEWQAEDEYDITPAIVEKAKDFTVPQWVALVDEAKVREISDVRSRFKNE